MDERENHPEMLETFVAGRPGRVRAWGGLWLAAGLLLLVGDWAARFGMFRWQDVWRPPSGPVAPSPECTIKGNVNRSGHCIYHRPESRWYAKIKMHVSKGTRWFCSVEEAEAAGCRETRR